MSEYTPGLMDCRWTVRRDDYGDVRIVGDPNPTEEGRELGAEWVIAKDVVSFREPSEQEEYARLIAAAPDLLGALEDIARADHIDRAILLAQEALAKARGEHT